MPIGDSNKYVLKTLRLTDKQTSKPSEEKEKYYAMTSSRPEVFLKT